MKFLISLFALLVFFSNCNNAGNNNQVKNKANTKLKVITTIFPIYYFAKKIGGDKVEASTILPPGQECHAFEPTPKSIRDVVKSDIFIYTGKYMEPWADKVIEAIKTKNIVISDTSANITLMDHEESESHSEENHNEQPFEWAGAFKLKKGVYTWSFSKKAGAYADPAMKFLMIKSDENDPIESIEEEAVKIFKAEAEKITSKNPLTAEKKLYQLEFDQNQDMTFFKFELAEDGAYTFFTEHSPYEFEDKEHYLQNLEKEDIEPIKEEPESGHGHDHHHHHGDKDPHIWLDPVLAKTMVDNIYNAYVKADEKNKDFYKKNADQLKEKLSQLHEGFLDLSKHSNKKTIIFGGHFAFNYFAKRYNLKVLSAYTGFSPDAEPSPKKIAELINALKENDLKYIYYEELINPKVAKIISEETGAQLLLLHGAHNLTKKERENELDYFAIMKGNLERLKLGLGYIKG